jgi:hypothetical protein
MTKIFVCKWENEGKANNLVLLSYWETIVKEIEIPEINKKLSQFES